MLKEAIRFHYSWQTNFLTTDMIVSLVGSYVGHKRKAMIHVAEEMKTKASDLNRLTEQIREKTDIGKYYI